METTECKGCRDEDKSCFIMRANVDCPCRKCLVKAMCSQACEDFYQAYRTQVDAKNGIRM